MRIDPQKVRRLAKRIRDAADDIDSAGRGRGPQVESAHSAMTGFSSAAALQRVSSALGEQLRGLHSRTGRLSTAMETAAGNHTATDRGEQERFLRYLDSLKH